MRKLFIAVAVVVLFISCNTDDMNNETSNPNPFIGTWETESSDPDCPSKMIFTADEITCYDKNNDIFVSVMTGDAIWKGTYIYKPTYTNEPYKSGKLEIYYAPHSSFEMPCRFEDSVLILQIDIRYSKVNS
jgi:hypothetical protein